MSTYSQWRKDMQTLARVYWHEGRHNQARMVLRQLRSTPREWIETTDDYQETR